jgi:acetyl esterase/lipase
VYKSVDGADLRLHIFNPQKGGTAAAPAIIFFFGGGFTNGPVTQFTPQSIYLAKRGMVAIVADYRVFGRHQTSPFEAIADAKSAIRWVRAHAEELGIDAERIAAGGGSSGGHLALSAALINSLDEVGEDRRISSKPDALVLFNPSLDTSPESGFSNGDAKALVKARFGNRWREGSPFHHLRPGLAPTLILQGKADETTPYLDAEKFCAEASKHGNQCQLFGYEAATHGFFTPDRADGIWYRETLLAVDRFLTDLGYLQGPSPTEIR